MVSNKVNKSYLYALISPPPQPHAIADTGATGHHKNNKPIIHGNRSKVDGLWHIPLPKYTLPPYTHQALNTTKTTVPRTPPIMYAHRMVLFARCLSGVLSMVLITLSCTFSVMYLHVGVFEYMMGGVLDTVVFVVLSA